MRALLVVIATAAAASGPTGGSERAGYGEDGNGGGPVPGQIVVDSDHPAWFKYHGAGPFFLCGPGDPEGFLYRGTRNPDGTRNGDQTVLIDKLAASGANSIYLMAVRSHGGDGGAMENPFIGGDPANSVSDSILDQWETWFTAMDDNGIVIYFFLYDDASCLDHPLWDTGDAVGPAEGQFIDTLVSRFKHHKHLIWCVKEEYSEALSVPRAERIAERIRSADDRHHPVAVHQTSGTSFDFNGSDVVHQFAAQFSGTTAEQLHADTVAAWENVKAAVNVNVAEFPAAGSGDVLRRKLWSVAMGGGYVMVFGMDIASTPPGDLSICGDLVEFMESTVFNRMTPRDDLSRSGTRYVLADPGNAYILYGTDTDTLGLLVEAGRYDLRWFDPVTGSWVLGGGVDLVDGDWAFPVPSGFQSEAVLYLAPDACTAAAPLPSARIDVEIEIESVGSAVTRDVTFFLSDCLAPADTRVLPVALDASGRGSVTIDDVDPNVRWVYAKEGHTLGRLAAVVFDVCGAAAVDMTGSHRLRSGDFGYNATVQDDRVDLIDFLILAAEWNVAIDPAASCGADANADGRQDTSDFTAIQINYAALGDPVDLCAP